LNIDRALCPKQKIGKTEFDNNQKRTKKWKKKSTKKLMRG
jgi:hypothetical protein